MKRLYTLLFYFNCAAALTTALFANLLQVQELVVAALFFAGSAVMFHIASKMVGD